ncbi:transposase [Vreelandella glaciei]|uniref:transposase n=1 Tax=Halomonadaceae TaxID=28256 RepID=UPI0030ECD8DB
MKKSRFSDSQILSILKQAEGGPPVPERCREHGMSSATFYKWRAKTKSTGQRMCTNVCSGAIASNRYYPITRST